MESPKINNKAEEAAVAITSSDTATVQDSPIFSYIGNLSPIKPDKAASVTQGFRGINSSPLEFTSPYINPCRQSLDLKRTQCPLSFSVELYRHDDKGKNIPTGVDESEKFNSQFSCGLNPRIEKVPASNSSRHDQTGSPTGCVDEYLADLLADCTDSTHSTNSGLEQSDNVSKLLDGSMNAKEPVAKLANKEGEQDLVVAVGASPASFEQDEEENQGSSASHLKPAEKDGETGGSGVASGQCLEVESNLPFNHAFEHQHSEQPVMEEYEERGETTGAVVPNAPALNIMTHVPKASQNQLGKRRRLQFEEAQHNSIANSPGSWNPSNSRSCSRSPVSSDNLEVLNLSCVDIPATPSNSQLGNMTQSKISRNPVMTVSKPSGIGLHLNSIVNSLPLHSVSTTSIKIADRSYSSVKARTEGCKPESHVSASASSASCPYPCSTKPPLKQVEHRATSDLSEKANSEHADIVEEFNQGSPRKKRKKTSETSDGDGCKRCNCKKTKCLKLYCDCFAAGIYCADPCACQGCFNRPEYEDTVLETRQQIESRNPLAFAPKIIQRLTKPPASNSGKDGDRSTPLSGRHKKGCNCKKSMCLKKYCECYQANVGCSDVCRCEGCKNIHGRKGERCIIREVDSTEAINDQLGYSFDQKREIVATTDSYLLPEFRNPSSLTPLTPSFQFSNHGKDASKSRLLSGRYLPSPESDNTFLPPNANVLGLPRNSAPHNMLLETRTEILDLGSFDQESDYANVEVVDEFSRRCRKLGNICHLNALTTYSEGPVSIDSPKRRELVNVSRLPYCSGSGRMSSISSCHWSGSPLTPGTPFTNTKLQQMESDNRLYDILEDDTPQILKENPTPRNAVKVNSPNKKRVSPPHSRLLELGSSSLTGLKSGRKFILQAVPSFPPLTPCIDSKDSFDENKNGPRNSSDKE